MTEPNQRASEDNKSSSTASPPRVDQAAEALKTNIVAGAHDLGEGVKHLASDVIGQTKKTASSQIDLGKSRAVEGLGSVANALRKTGENLRDENNDSLTSVLDSAAQKVDSATGYLKDKSFGDILVDMKDFARREPALFLGGALVVGLVGGRFLKSSTPSSSSSSSSNDGPSTQKTPARLGAAPLRSSAHAQAGQSTQQGGHSSHSSHGGQSSQGGASSSSPKKDESTSSTQKKDESTSSKGSDNGSSKSSSGTGDSTPSASKA